ncbi:MAG TPA: hypothetical protein VF319_18520 [Caldimonas sp.]
MKLAGDSISRLLAGVRKSRRKTGKLALWRNAVRDPPQKEMNMLESLALDVWLERCARRIVEFEPEIADPEARRIARELQDFERTRAMEPEAAVDFVAEQLAKPDRSRFERRLAPRN